MLELSNRYLHGYVAIPIILKCLEKGFFELLNEKKDLSIAEISQKLDANEGHLTVALRLFESLHWLEKKENSYELIMLPNEHEFIRSIPKQLLDWYDIPRISLLKELQYRTKLRWGLQYLNKSALPSTSMLTDFSHGTVIVPLLLALKNECFLDSSALDQPFSLTCLPKDISQLILTFFVTKGWAEHQKNGFFLTDGGKSLFERVLNLGTVASYASMLSKMQELLFGDPKEVFKRDIHDHELHVDRSLNVLASGFQHERYFMDVEEMIISIFNRKTYASQPHYVIDMGCGDGSFLKRIYEIICAQTERGKVIQQYPIVMIGVDYNQKALQATQVTLQNIPHYTLQGDIADPKRLIDDLKSLGIKDPENSLHVRSFLDHDRPFILPSQNKENFRSRIFYQGVYVDKEGKTIPAAIAIQSLVEHLQNWSSIITKHGLIVLEVHCLTPQTVFPYLDQNESLHFDAYHAFSMQHLVEADVFLLSAAEAGLFSNLKFSKRYPNVFPYTRITLSYFEKRDYVLEYAKESDLLRLVELEAYCWPEHLRVSHEKLSQRIKQFPEGQLVMKMNGEIIGVVYTQRIASVDVLKQTSFNEVAALHMPQGTIIQLIGINIVPEMQDRGFGDQLLEFMLQWCSLKENIEKLVGVTRCKNYQQQSQFTLQEYVDQHISNSEGIDPILRFHTSHGAKIVEILPNYRAEDRDNQGAGILIEYNIHHRRSHQLEVNQDKEKAIVNNKFSLKTVYDCIAELVPQKYAPQFSHSLSLRDMGFDSLGLLELKTLLNRRFKINIDSTFFFQYTTPAAIASYFQELEDSSPSPDFQSTSAHINCGDIEKPSSHLIREKPQALQPPLSTCEPIAIIGMACRFPGKINNLADYWDVLKCGQDVICKVPPHRLERGTIPQIPFEGGYLDDVDMFDAGFFRISPREAKLMDPQQRLLLEVAWHALEEAGINPNCLKGSQTGVFVGIFSHDYETLINKNQSAETLDAYFGTGNSASVAAGRLSYIFGLHGPSLAVNTACSSSLVAVHLACQSLHLGESTMALAGGVNLILSSELGSSFSNAGMLSPDGRCKTFDIAANGYGRGEGCGIVILKPISQALKDGDRVLAIIPSTSVNQDGASNGLTAPNITAQKDLMRASFKNTHFEPHTISYIEAHGTGTSLGDPIEVKALAEIYGQGRTKENPLMISSVKTNIGHTEAAAGIAGLIKVILALQHKEIPPHVHFTQLNPHIDLDTRYIQIPTTLLPWLANQEHPRRGAVSSFGFSGTNAHVLIEEGPEVVLSTQQTKPYYLVTLSAKHSDVLKKRIEDLSSYLRNGPKLPLEAIAYTLNVGRSHFIYRFAVVVSSLEELSETLEQVQKGQNPKDYFQGDPASELNNKEIYDEVLANLTQKLKTSQDKKHLLALANLYTQGMDLDWNLLHEGEAHEKVSLPSYPFLKERYWIADKDLNSKRVQSEFLQEKHLSSHSIAGEKDGKIVLELPQHHPLPSSFPSKHLNSPSSVPKTLLRRLDLIDETPKASVETPVSLEESCVELWDYGQGVFCIKVNDSSHENMLTESVMAELVKIFGAFREQADAKVVLLTGGDRFFISGEIAEREAFFQRKIPFLILECDIPVIAVMKGHSQGLGWLLGALCDFMICSEESSYRYLDCDSEWIPSMEEYAFFAERFGRDVEHTSIFFGKPCNGQELKEKGFGMPVLSQTEVDAYALNFACSLANAPREVLIQLKRHFCQEIALLAKKLAGLMTPFSNGKSYLSSKEIKKWEEERLSVADWNLSQHVEKVEVIPMTSSAVRVEAYENGVVRVTLCDKDNKNMFSDALIKGVTEAFAHIRRVSAYKVVILTGYDHYFSCGGTQEGLLAIWNGTAKYSDFPLYRFPLDCEIPVIAAMQGHGIGAGWSMGMFCDLVIFSEESVYLSAFMRYGFTPGFGSTLIFPERFGKDLGREILFAAREYRGEELKRRGVKMPVLPRTEVQNYAMALAKQMAVSPREILVQLKAEQCEGLRAQIGKTEQLELTMHAKTFFNNEEVLHRIQTHFNQEREIQSNKVNQDLMKTDNQLLTTIRNMLRHLLANELHLKQEDIEEKMAFTEMGMDSISGVTWVRKINDQYKLSIPATHVYKYSTIHDFAQCVMKEGQKQGLFQPKKAHSLNPLNDPKRILKLTISHDGDKERVSYETPQSLKKNESSQVVVSTEENTQAIAIIGMAGQFPKATTLDEFWDNLVQGRDCVSEIPPERWSIATYYDHHPEVSGKTYSKWMGVLENADKFDPLFFNISPREAELMDPQQRLFLQACWSCIEDAGCDYSKLSGSQCAVFSGCASNDYGKLMKEENLSAQHLMGGSPAILAARISYLLNLKGPSVAIDTACSSSLVAIVNACDNLILGNCDLALAGGVCVMPGPTMHIMTSQGGMLSPEGHCFTFDQRANGFVPGEGVGVILLKRLNDAIRDKDPIQGVIRGWGMNQDGKTNGITAPNPDSQTQLEKRIYQKYGINPEKIQLIEAHGSGTKLGDPIEVEGLTESFRYFTEKKNYCALGTVKSNIGHLLTAAGVSGVIKVLMALRHRKIPPTINFETLNEHIKLTNSPFYINTACKDWNVSEGQKRCAAISSFGLSGTNAHIVLEEYSSEERQESGSRKEIKPSQLVIIPLSAKNTERLLEYVKKLLVFIQKNSCESKESGQSKINLSDLAYTLQIGREAMEERIGLIVTSMSDLEEKLNGIISGIARIEGVYRGQVKPNKDILATLAADEDMMKTIEIWIEKRKYSKLLDLWVKGLILDWNKLYGEKKPCRIALPTYPFALERYWISTDDHSSIVTQQNSVQKQYSPKTSSNLPEESYTVLEKVWKAVSSGEGSQASSSVDHLIIIANQQTSALARMIAKKFKSTTLILNDESNSASVKSPLQDFLLMDFGKADAGKQTGQALLKSCQNGVRLIDLSDLGDDFPTQLNEIPWGKFSLLQQLIASISAPIYFLHITQGLITWRCSKPTLKGAVMAGLIRSLGAEYGKLQAKTIDIDLPLEKIEAISNLISLEFARDEAAGEVCYRNQQRYLPAMETLTTQPLHSLLTIKPTLAIDPTRVYVVTGGTRGIGAVMAQHMVSQGARKLVLMGIEQLPARSEWPAYLNSSQTKPELTAKLQQIIELERSGATVELYSGALTDSLALTSFFTHIRQALGPIGGVVHCAGTVNFAHPAFIHKTVEEMEAVCEPKILGLTTLHQVFLEDCLDFFLLFSSVSGLIPTLSVGVSDYAFANTFMDYFAAYQASQGHPYYRSIQWPLWNGVGMIRKMNSISLPYRELGLCSHNVTQGVELLNMLMKENAEKTCLMPALINTYLFNPMRLLASKISKSFQPLGPPLIKQQHVSSSLSSEPLSESHTYLSRLRDLFATELKLPHAKLDNDTIFGEWGVDSVLLIELVKKIETRWNVTLPPSLLLEYPTLAQLSQKLESLYPYQVLNKEPPPLTISSKSHNEKSLLSADNGAGSHLPEVDTRVAVIGIACHFPGAADKEAFWQNLCHGVCSIQEVSSVRWEVEKFYSPSSQKGKSISKWGGFIEGIEYFDPTFFGFDNADAASIDPLIRQCLEVSAQVLCDAGYTKEELGQKKVGVFVGSRVSTYAQRVDLNKNTVVATGQNFISAHISHFFNFTGPSLVIDTACSSSLVSVHQACQSLFTGESEICLAGGVDILLDETPYLALSEAQALSPDGLCHTFDEKANGLVPGEGCGMVLLKPLNKAMQEGDRIYAVIEAGRINNDGRTMGITTPNPQAQQALVEATLQKGKISADTISYVETHGTGTAIGDPIELKALSAAFGGSIHETPWCAVGSVKTNIGHLLSAAGIASFIKVALSLYYKQIPPTLHCKTPNPRFDFSHSPFRPNQALQDWKPLQGIRRASISSFGFGGTNAHLILREAENNEINVRARPPLPAIIFQRQYYWKGKKNKEENESTQEQLLQPKTFKQILTNDNEIVRDHRVYEVRILPGVTFLDMIYRLVSEEFKTKNLVLKNILFQEPIATSQEADKIIRLSLTKQTSHWNIDIQSQKSKGDVPLESGWLKNATCELHLGVSDVPSHLKVLDIDLLKRKFQKVFALEELYASARQMGIWHGEFMRPSGQIYQSADSCLMEVVLSPLAQAQSAQFYLHPALLDASTSMLFAIRPQGGIQTDHSAYIPLFIKEFQAFATLPEICYIYAKRPQSQTPSIDDLLACDLQIYHPQGHLLAYFEQLTGKRIRTQASITRLIAKETDHTVNLPSTSHIASSSISIPVDKFPSEGSLSAFILQDLQKRIGSLLNNSSLSIDTATNFYELGLDSKQLVTLVRDLEVQLGCQLYPTLLFEYNTLAKLTDHLVENHAKAYEAVRSLGEKNSIRVKREVIEEKTTAIQESLPEELQYYTSLWMNQPISINLQKEDLPSLKSLCILSDDIELVEAFRQHLAPVPVIQLKSGQFYRKLNETTYQVNIAERISYETYLKDFKQAGYSFSHILFARGDEQTLAHLREVLFFSQTLLSNHVKGPLYGLNLFTCHKETVSPAWMFAGFARSLRREQSAYHWDILEVEAEQSTQSLIESLCAEWRAASQNTMTTHARYREGRRQTQQYTSIHPEKHFQTTELWRRGGVYLITGGLGGIGLHVAEFLAKKYQAKLVLTGRSPLAGAQKEILQRLLKQGGEVLYLSGDVTSLEAVQDWVTQAKNRFGKLNGIIHSAGIIADSLLIEKHWDTFHAVLAPKVIGTANLDKVTALESLDFFMLFSSLAGVMGNIGQSDYSSANAFMDGFAAWREELVKMGKRSGKTRSINWPLWAEGGMQVDASTAEYLNRLGFAPLPTEKGLTALTTSLQQPHAQCAVIYGSHLQNTQLLLPIPFAQSSANDIYMPRPSMTTSSSMSAELTTVVTEKDSDIAIIGVSGLYPGADNLDQFWTNLTLGRDFITEIPSVRWDWRLYYDVDKDKPGKSYSKWGSFLQDYDKFDPLFFNISSREAELMDPQERLFLQVAWQTFEDAGYVPGRFSQSDLFSLSKKQVGVFVGVMFSLYQLYSSEENLKGQHPLAINSLAGSIANRVSYCLNLQGPSLALDTMCSSSLTAIHLACESLRRGECHLALAGGVNLITHPSKYVFLSQSRFLASDGRCKSFGEGGDGYVPGEGVGAVLLKPLSNALKDGDRIWGVIKGSSLNHGGYTAGYSVPSGEAQSVLIKAAVEKAQIPPDSISYIEAHGTGTSLGDPIEIRGLSKAFEGVDRQTCSIGSIKSNLGHLESAAGMAALTKVLLQFKHRQLVPSIHAETLNAHIPFAETPFYVQRELADWQTKAGYPLRAGISSFGAGGSNAHIILEEAPKQLVRHGKTKPYYLVTLSAKHQDSLQQQIADLHIYLKNFPDISLESLAYTLNVGRSHFNFRCAVVTSNIEEFKTALEKLQLAQTPADCFRGQADKVHEDGAIYKKILKGSFEELKTIELSDLSTYKENMETLANLYIKGYQLDWTLLHHGESHQKVSLPTYPFLKEHYWLPKESASSLNLSQVHFDPVQEALHPLLDKNISTFDAQIYQKTLLPEEVYLAHHLVFDQAILPGTAYLEMARAAGTMAGGRPVTLLKDVMWQRPIVSKGVPIDVQLKLHPTENGQGATFQLFTNVDDKLLLHAKGELEYESAAPSLPVSLFQGEDLKSILARCEYLCDKTQMYVRLKEIGFDYGPSFQVTQALYGNAYEGAALLCLPLICQEKASQHVLHPMLLDGALRAVFAIQHPILQSSTLHVPFYLESLKIYRELPTTVYSYARLVPSNGSEKQEKHLQLNVIHIDILTEQGELCVSLRGFKALPFRREETKEVFYYYQPQWTGESLVSSKKEPGHNNLMVLSDPHDAFSVSIISGISSNGMEPWPDTVLQILPSTVFDGKNSNIGSVEASYMKGLTDWLKFFKTWQGTAPEKSLHYVMVYEATSPTAQPHYTALASLSRAVKLLSPNLTMAVLGVHPENTRQPAWIDRLYDELHHRQDKSVYYASTGQRLVRRLTEISPANPLEPHSLPLRKQGVYLITGGYGGLGKHFARFLSKHYQAKIILLGRSPLDSDKKQFLAELRALGGEAYYVSVDLGANQTALEIALSNIVNQVGEIQGVIHAAGVVSPLFANVVEDTDFLRACEAKVDGTVHLDHVTQIYPLDFFVNFSSISSELGDFGVGSYAFSNRFMDEFMHWRADLVQQGLRRGLSLSIQWPYWKDGGMHLPQEAMKVYHNYSGLGLLDTEQGLASFEHCLTLGLANVLVVSGDKVKLERTLGIR